MNRQQRRKAGIKDKDPTYSMTLGQIRNVANSTFSSNIDTIKDEITADMLVMLFALPIEVLRKTYGWGNDRLVMFANRLIDLATEAVNDGSINDIVKDVERCTGIKFGWHEEEAT